MGGYLNNYSLNLKSPPMVSELRIYNFFLVRVCGMSTAIVVPITLSFTLKKNEGCCGEEGRICFFKPLALPLSAWFSLLTSRMGKLASLKEGPLLFFWRDSKHMGIIVQRNIHTSTWSLEQAVPLYKRAIMIFFRYFSERWKAFPVLHFYESFKYVIHDKLLFRE